MNLRIIILSSFLSILSMVSMSYITMATPVGPWIAPTLMLLVLFLSSLLREHLQDAEMVWAVSAGSIGGIIATGLGFAFPTYYFLDADQFMHWVSAPLSFMGAITCLALCAGGLGIWVAALFDYHFLEREQLAFPIGELLFEMLHIKKYVIKSHQLIMGFLGTFLFCFLKDGMGKFLGIFPQSIIVVPELRTFFWQIPVVRFDVAPIWWAVGFISGASIVLPLFVGAVSRIIFLDPVHDQWFMQVAHTDFMVAFCSGMALYGVVYSFVKLGLSYRDRLHGSYFETLKNFKFSAHNGMYSVGISAMLCMYFAYYDFSIGATFFIIILSVIFAYQIISIAGRIGIAPLGRYATFAMIPALIIFGLTDKQVALLSAFIEICCGVAADVLFSQKLALRLSLDRKMVYLYQIFGLIVSSITAGVVFYLLIVRFGLGSEELFAYKAQARALIVGARHFNVHGIIIGVLYAIVITWTKINPMLVFGGLLMPVNISLGLSVGALLSTLVQDKRAWEPFWSGVFAANSLWMVFRALV